MRGSRERTKDTSLVHWIPAFAGMTIPPYATITRTSFAKQ